MEHSIPQAIKRIAAKHKIKCKTYDTYYNLLYDLARYEPDVCGLELERNPDFRITDEYLKFKTSKTQIPSL